MKGRTSLQMVKAMILVGFGLIWYGCGNNLRFQSEGQVSSYDVPVEVDIVFPRGFRFVTDQSYDNRLTAEVLRAYLAREVSLKLRSLGISPSNLPEFYRFELNLLDFTGCSNWYYGYFICDRAFNVPLRFELYAGNENIDSLPINAPVDRMQAGHLKRRLRWAVGRAIDDMARNGALGDIGQHTPYF